LPEARRCTPDSVEGAAKLQKLKVNETCCNSIDCCAERRLIRNWVSKARRHGCKSSLVVSWVRRKAGSHISVWRFLSDGSMGCSMPCILCRIELIRFDLTVHFQCWDGMYDGKMTADGAPRSKLTSGQKASDQANKTKDTKILKQ
jgi:hypothetical protein